MDTPMKKESIDASSRIEEKKGGILPIVSFVLSLSALSVALYAVTHFVPNEQLSPLKAEVKTIKSRLEFADNRHEFFENSLNLLGSGVAEKVEYLNKRLSKAEAAVAGDMKERARAELYKILINIKEVSRLTDHETRSKIVEVERMLKGIITPSDQQDVFMKNNDTLPEKIRKEEHVSDVSSDQVSPIEVLGGDGFVEKDDSPEEAIEKEEDVSKEAEEGVNEKSLELQPAMEEAKPSSHENG